MSRTTRHDIRIPMRPREFTVQEALGKIQREVKRRMIADKVIVDPSKARPKFDWHWAVGDRGLGGVVSANTKGEAKSQIKKAMGLGKNAKLPSVIQIVKVVPSAATDERVAACQIGPNSG